MPFIPAPNVAQVEMRYLNQDQRCENTIYIRAPLGLDSGQMQLMATAMETWWRNEMKPFQSASCILNEIYLTDLTSQDGFTYSHPVTIDNAGARGSQPLPNNVTLCVSFRTLRRGRSARGRNYFIGLTEDMVNGNEIATLMSDNIRSGYEQLFGPFDLNNWQWVVVSRYSNGQPRASAQILPVQSVIIVDSYVDSMRRRLPARGT